MLGLIRSARKALSLDLEASIEEEATLPLEGCGSGSSLCAPQGSQQIQWLLLELLLELLEAFCF